MHERVNVIIITNTYPLIVSLLLLCYLRDTLYSYTYYEHRYKMMKW